MAATCLLTVGLAGFAPAATRTDFQVNTYTTSSQAAPDVGTDASGNFVVVWMSNGQSIPARRSPTYAPASSSPSTVSTAVRSRSCCGA